MGGINGREGCKGQFKGTRRHKVAFLAAINGAQESDKAFLQRDQYQVIYFMVHVHAERAQEVCAVEMVHDETAIPNGNGKHVDQCRSTVDAGLLMHCMVQVCMRCLFMPSLCMLHVHFRSPYE